MRKDLYEHLQRLPVEFHDRWASGQLLSRATMDLQILRMFLVFPLVFLVVNSATILIGFAILFTQSALLGLVLLAADHPADHPVLVLREPLRAGRPPGPGPGRRPGHAGRGVGARHPDHQGVRAAPQPGRRLPRADPRPVAHRDAQGPAAGRHLGRHHDAARDRDRRRARARRAPGLRRQAVRRHAGRLPVDGAHPALAGGVDRLPARDEQRGGDGRRPLLRGDGHPARRHLRHASPSRPPTACAWRASASATPTPRPDARTAHRRRPAHPPRRDDGPGRRHRQRQDHADRAAAPAARGHRRPDHPGRRRHRRTPGRPPARTGRGRLRGAHAVLGDRTGERRDGRGPGRRGRAGRTAGAGRGPVRLRGRAAGRRRHAGRRAGAEPVRRAAAAARAGPGGGRPAALPGARRPAVRAGRAHRGAGRGRAAGRAAGDHRAGRGPPAVDRDARRPGRAAVRAAGSPPSARTPNCCARAPSTGI